MKKPKLETDYGELLIPDEIWNEFINNKYCIKCNLKDKQCVNFSEIVNEICDSWHDFLFEYNTNGILSEEIALFLESIDDDIRKERNTLSQSFEINGIKYTVIAIGENIEEGHSHNPYLSILIYKNKNQS